MNIRWTDEMFDFIKNNWQTMTDVEMATFLTRVYGDLGFSKRTLEHVRARLGLIKYEIPANKKESVTKVSPGLMGAWLQAVSWKDGGPPGESG